MLLFILRRPFHRTRVFMLSVTGVCTAWLLLGLPAPASAQTTTMGSVHGTVLDPDAAIIPGAAITLLPVTGSPVLGTSGSDGSFRIGAPAGIYTVTVSMPGFATYSKSGVKILPGQSVALDAKLIVGEQTQIVNVTTDTATVGVDPDSNASSTTIKGKDLDALSDDPDELSSELSALAGPAAGPNGGQIYVDGFTGGQLPPKSSIREIRINQNPFSAEYDRLGYGRVEVFTKPGTDKFHGSLSTQGNTGAFNTSNPFLGSTGSQPPYYTFFLLGNVTGPISKTSSFSLGGSRRNIRLNAIVNPTAFFAASANSTALCDPGPNSPCSSFVYPVGSRAILQPQLRSEISPRFDFALGPKNVLTVRYQYESATTENGGFSNSGTTLPTAVYNSSNNEHEIQVSDTQTVSSKIVNETRFEYQRETSNQHPLSTLPTVNVQGVFTGGGNGTQNFASTSTHIEIQNYTSVALAKNFIRFGGRLRTTGEAQTSSSGSNGSFTYTYLLDPCSDPSLTNKPATCVASPSACAVANAGFSSYQCGIPSQFRLTTINQATINTRQTDLGLYVEDDWKFRPNLTVSAGLRLETQNAIHSNHDFAPRLSVAYGIPRADGKAPITVVRGGFGIFYERFGLNNLLTVQQYNITGPAQSQVTVSSPGPLCRPNLTTNTQNFAPCLNGIVSRPSLATTYTLAGNMRSSYTMQGAFGVDQQVRRLGTVSVNYLLSRGNHEYLTRVTPTPTAYNYTYHSGGVFNQQQLFVNVNIRTKSVTMFGFYALGFANANTSGANFIPTRTDTHVDYGRASFNTRSFSVAGASWNAPYHFTVSPFMIVRSGAPYNVTTGTDLNGDSQFNDRPAFNTGGTAASCSVSNTFNANPGAVYTEIPINYCTGPTNFSVNLRAGRTFGFGPKLDGAAVSATGGSGGNRGGGPGGIPGIGGAGGRGGPMGGGSSYTGRRYNLNLGAQAQNLFNVVPYSIPVGTLSSAQFGRFTSLAGRPFSSSNAVRSITLQATLNF